MIRVLLYRMSIIIIAFWTLALLPSPTDALPLRLKNGLVGVFFVLALGKTLYDTLFYDRYRP